MRLGDLDALRQDWLENGENEYVYDTNSFLESIDEQPTIDPEDLPIVKELREQLAKVTAERDAAIKEPEDVWVVVDEISDLIDEEVHPVSDYNTKVCKIIREIDNLLNVLKKIEKIINQQDGGKEHHLTVEEVPGYQVPKARLCEFLCHQVEVG